MTYQKCILLSNLKLVKYYICLAQYFTISESTIGRHWLLLSSNMYFIKIGDQVPGSNTYHMFWLFYGPTIVAGTKQPDWFFLKMYDHDQKKTTLCSLSNTWLRNHTAKLDWLGQKYVMCALWDTALSILENPPLTHP